MCHVLFNDSKTFVAYLMSKCISLEMKENFHINNINKHVKSTSITIMIIIIIIIMIIIIGKNSFFIEYVCFQPWKPWEEGWWM